MSTHNTSKDNLYGDLSLENISSNILPFYGLGGGTIEEIKFKDTAKQRAVYKVTYKNNSYCLKKVYYDLPELLFVYSSIEWWYRYDINVPKLLPTLQGNRYAQWNEKLFILTPWIVGEKCNYDNYDHLNSLTINLAKMHKSALDFFPIDNSNYKESFDILYNSVHKHWENMLIYSNLAFKYKDEFSKIYINNFDTNYNLGSLSSKLAYGIDNSNLTRTLCHGDYVNKNLIFDENNKIWVIDFDKACLDFAAHDISYGLRRLFKRDDTNWDLSLCIDLLCKYNSIYTLTLDDYKYILSYLSFPQKYWKVSRDYYNNIKKCNKKSFCTILKKATKNSDSQLLFAHNFKAYIEDKFDTKI